MGQAAGTDTSKCRCLRSKDRGQGRIHTLVALSNLTRDLGKHAAAPCPRPLLGDSCLDRFPSGEGEPRRYDPHQCAERVRLLRAIELPFMEKPDEIVGQLLTVDSIAVALTLNGPP